MLLLNSPLHTPRFPPGNEGSPNRGETRAGMRASVDLSPPYGDATMATPLLALPRPAGIFLFLIPSLLDTCALREALRHRIERVAQHPARTDLGGSTYRSTSTGRKTSKIFTSSFGLRAQKRARQNTLFSCSTGLRASLEIMKPDLQKTKKFVFCMWEFSNCPRPCHQLTRKNSMETGIYQGAGFMMV